MPVPQVPPSALRVAKVRDAFTGGHYADREERIAAGEILARFPAIADAVRAARRCHADAALRAVTREGARGVVFGACGFPCEPCPHAAALEAVPSARFAYCSVEPRVTYYSGGELGGPNVAACRGSLRRPAELLALPEIAAIGGPLQVQAQLSAHYWPDRQGPELMAEYARLLPPGSTILLTAGIADATDAGRAFLAMLSAASGLQAQARTAREVVSWLKDAGFRVRWADVTDVRTYGRKWAESRLPHYPPGRIVAVTGRLPRRRGR